MQCGQTVVPPPVEGPEVLPVPPSTKSNISGGKSSSGAGRFGAGADGLGGAGRSTEHLRNVNDRRKLTSTFSSDSHQSLPSI